MSRIVGMNGHPLGHDPQVLRPGEAPVNFQLAMTERGVAIVITNGAEQLVIPVPPDNARKLAIALISQTAIWEATQANAARQQRNLDATDF